MRDKKNWEQEWKEEEERIRALLESQEEEKETCNG